MSLAVLPYPSMDFTPLDILTADELDQIVANYEAINNATIQTTNIANGAVTSPKLTLTVSTVATNWKKVQLGTNINVYFTSGTLNLSQAGSSWQQYVVAYAPTGFVTTNTSYGFVSGVSADSAEIVTGVVGDNGNVIVQMNNQYTGTVSNPVGWDAMLVEFL